MMIYVHIPFCVRKCPYCDFVSFKADRETEGRYIDKLIEEIKECSGMLVKKPVTSVFIGGGTPTVLSAEQLAKILDTLREHHDISDDAEITVEANPGTVSLEKLKALKKEGVNRISFGMQSANDKTLKTLGRIHVFSDVVSSYEDARSAGFENINLDLISAVPGETVDDYLHSVETVAGLRPEHVSAYSLIIEEGTPFYERYKSGDGLPGEDEERLMYKRTRDTLEKYGYHRYEVSNYALEGRECRHNKGYWTLRDYAGYGLGAAGLITTKDGRYRTRNTSSIEEYLKSPSDSREKVFESEKDETEEFMFLGLRMDRGIDTREFKTRFGRNIEDVYGSIIKKHMAEGVLLKEGSMLRLTDRGMDISNIILCDYLL